jgi:hypothetical protein
MMQWLFWQFLNCFPSNSVAMSINTNYRLCLHTHESEKLMLLMYGDFSTDLSVDVMKRQMLERFMANIFLSAFNAHQCYFFFIVIGSRFISITRKKTSLNASPALLFTMIFPIFTKRPLKFFSDPTLNTYGKWKLEYGQ